MSVETRVITDHWEAHEGDVDGPCVIKFDHCDLLLKWIHEKARKDARYMNVHFFIMHVHTVAKLERVSKPSGCNRTFLCREIKDNELI